MTNRVIVHWTKKSHMRRLYLEGFSIEEIVIMYNTTRDVVKNILTGLEAPERI